jgi:O-6-methylguanine DNA methyltransferase
LREAVDALKHHLAGRPVDFSGPFDLAGTEFQQRVWQLLRKIPWGATTTYGELAKALSAPNAARAVGQAVGANPACILVPCHRVVGKQGDLTGFAWGVELKAALLAMERDAHASSAIPALSSI